MSTQNESEKDFSWCENDKGIIDDLCIVRNQKTDKLGVINHNGKEVIPFIHDIIWRCDASGWGLEKGTVEFETYIFNNPIDQEVISHKHYDKNGNEVDLEKLLIEKYIICNILYQIKQITNFIKSRIPEATKKR